MVNNSSENPQYIGSNMEKPEPSTLTAMPCIYSPQEKVQTRFFVSFLDLLVFSAGGREASSITYHQPRDLAGLL